MLDSLLAVKGASTQISKREPQVSDKQGKKEEENIQISFRTTEATRRAFNAKVASLGLDGKEVLSAFVADYISGPKPAVPISIDKMGRVAVPKQLVPAVSAFVAWIQSEPKPGIETKLRRMMLDLLGVKTDEAATLKENGA